MSKRLCFIAYGGGHMAMLIPLIKRLAADSNYDIKIIALTTAADLLQKENIPYLSIKDFVGPEDAQALQWGEELAADLPAHPSVPRAETIAYLGLNFAELAIEKDEANARENYAKQGRQLFLPVKLMQRILTQLAPDLLIATNSPRAERAAFMAARALAIPSLCLVDMFALQEIQWLAEPGYADRICVFSDFTREFFIARGVPPERVITTGNPVFDTFANFAATFDRAAYRTAQGWRAEEKIILLASQAEPSQHPFAPHKGDPERPRKLYQALLNVIEHHANWRLVVRFHPSEGYVAYPPHPRVKLNAAANAPLHAQLLAADCVVSSSSTAGLEAALLGTPLVQPLGSIFSEDAPFYKMGIAIPAADFSKLDSAITRAMSAPKAAAGLPHIGQATDNVLQIIQQLLADRVA